MARCLQLGEAQKRLSEAEAQLAQIQNKGEAMTQEGSVPLTTDCNKLQTEAKKSPKSEQNGFRIVPQPRPLLVIPPAVAQIGAMKSADVMKPRSTPDGRIITSSHGQSKFSGTTVDIFSAEPSDQSESDDLQNGRPKQKSGM